jgi:hypothetical protein
MTVKNINDALERCLKGKDSYAGLVHSLFQLECSDDLIKAILVGALGEHLKDRVAPLIAMVRAYDDLSPAEQIDMLYSIVEQQDALAQSDARNTKITA